MAMPTERIGKYRWLWYFVVLGLLTAGGIIANTWYNLRQQLTPEQLEAARQLWIKNGPRDYRLYFTIKREINPDPAGVAADRYSVEVHDGKLTAVYGPDDKRIDPCEMEPDDHNMDTMDDLFTVIALKLQADSEPGKPRAFATATFDAKDGHVIHYVHSVMQTRERLEVTVELVRETANKP
jgi:hypothetical protein